MGCARLDIKLGVEDTEKTGLALYCASESSMRGATVAMLPRRQRARQGADGALGKRTRGRQSIGLHCSAPTRHPTWQLQCRRADGRRRRLPAL